MIHMGNKFVFILPLTFSPLKKVGFLNYLASLLVFLKCKPIYCSF